MSKVGVRINTTIISGFSASKLLWCYRGSHLWVLGETKIVQPWSAQCLVSWVSLQGAYRHMALGITLLLQSGFDAGTNGTGGEAGELYLEAQQNGRWLHWALRSGFWCTGMGHASCVKAGASAEGVSVHIVPFVLCDSDSSFLISPVLEIQLKACLQVSRQFCEQPIAFD